MNEELKNRKYELELGNSVVEPVVRLRAERSVATTKESKQTRHSEQENSVVEALETTKVSKQTHHSEYEMRHSELDSESPVKIVKLSDICEPRQWKTLSTQELKPSGFSVYGANGKIGFYSEYNHKNPTLMIACRGSCGKVNVSEPFSWINGNAMCLDNLSANVDLKYLEHYLKNYDFSSVITGTVQPQITRENINKVRIKLFSLQTQKQIAARLDLCADTIAKHKKLLELHETLVKSQFVKMFGDILQNDKNWNISEWNQVLNIINGKNQKDVVCEDGKYLLCGSGGIMGKATDYLVKENSVIIGRKGNINKPILMREKFWNIDTAFGLVPLTNKINVEYLYYFCLFFDFEKLNKTVTIPSLTKSDLLKIKIPVPPLALQEKFASFVLQVEKSKQTVQKSLEKAETLYKALMQKYFG